MQISNKNSSRIKTTIIILAIALIIIDIILVTTKDRFPTFSKVIYTERAQLLWLTFLFGALVSKIFFNRFCDEKTHEYSGIILLIIITLGLFVASKLLHLQSVSLLTQLALLICGGLLSHYLWPQHTNKPIQ